MNLFRIIAIAMVVWLLIRMLRGYRQRIRHNRTRHDNGNLDTMVQCARCGLHVPHKEAISRGGRLYCCKQHADEG